MSRENDHPYSSAIANRYQDRPGIRSPDQTSPNVTSAIARSPDPPPLVTSPGLFRSRTLSPPSLISSDPNKARRTSTSQDAALLQGTRLLALGDGQYTQVPMWYSNSANEPGPSEVVETNNAASQVRLDPCREPSSSDTYSIPSSVKTHNIIIQGQDGRLYSIDPRMLQRILPQAPPLGQAVEQERSSSQQPQQSEQAHTSPVLSFDTNSSTQGSSAVSTGFDRVQLIPVYQRPSSLQPSAATFLQTLKSGNNSMYPHYALSVPSTTRTSSTEQSYSQGIRQSLIISQTPSSLQSSAAPNIRQQYSLTMPSWSLPTSYHATIPNSTDEKFTAAHTRVVQGNTPRPMFIPLPSSTNVQPSRTEGFQEKAICPTYSRMQLPNRDTFSASAASIVNTPTYLAYQQATSLANKMATSLLPFQQTDPIHRGTGSTNEAQRSGICDPRSYLASGSTGFTRAAASTSSSGSPIQSPTDPPTVLPHLKRQSSTDSYNGMHSPAKKFKAESLPQSARLTLLQRQQQQEEQEEEEQQERFGQVQHEQQSTYQQKLQQCLQDESTPNSDVVQPRVNRKLPSESSHTQTSFNKTMDSSTVSGSEEEERDQSDLTLATKESISSTNLDFHTSTLTSIKYAALSRFRPQQQRRDSRDSASGQSSSSNLERLLLSGQRGSSENQTTSSSSEIANVPALTPKYSAVTKTTCTDAFLRSIEGEPHFVQFYHLFKSSEHSSKLRIRVLNTGGTTSVLKWLEITRLASHIDSTLGPIDVARLLLSSNGLCKFQLLFPFCKTMFSRLMPSTKSDVNNVLSELSPQYVLCPGILDCENKIKALGYHPSNVRLTNVPHLCRYDHEKCSLWHIPQPCNMYSEIEGGQLMHHMCKHCKNVHSTLARIVAKLCHNTTVEESGASYLTLPPVVGSLPPGSGVASPGLGVAVSSTTDKNPLRTRRKSCTSVNRKDIVDKKKRLIESRRNSAGDRNEFTRAAGFSPDQLLSTSFNFPPPTSSSECSPSISTSPQGHAISVADSPLISPDATRSIVPSPGQICTSRRHMTEDVSFERQIGPAISLSSTSKKLSIGLESNARGTNEVTFLQPLGSELESHIDVEMYDTETDKMELVPVSDDAVATARHPKLETVNKDFKSKIDRSFVPEKQQPQDIMVLADTIREDGQTVETTTRIADSRQMESEDLNSCSQSQVAKKVSSSSNERTNENSNLKRKKRKKPVNLQS